MSKPVYIIYKQQSLCSLSGTYIDIIGCLDSIIPENATSEIPKLLIAPVAEQTGLGLTWFHNAKGRLF